MSKKKILIIDDSKIYRMLTKAALEKGPYEIFEADNGLDGLSLVQSQHPDLIVTDVLMPSMDGYEFLKRLRSDSKYNAVKVIFYTGTFSEKEETDLAKKGGVIAHLLKPTDPTHLLQTVQDALSASTPPVEAMGTSFEQDHLRILTNRLTQKVEELEKVNERLQAEIIRRTQAEEEAVTAKNFFQSLADSIPNLAWQSDLNGNIKYVNQRWLQFLGNTSTISEWSNFIHADDRPQFLSTISEAFQKHNSFQCEARLLMKESNKYIPHLLSAIAIQDEKMNISWFGTCTDISIQKDYEANLIHLKEQAENLSKAKTEFLSNISHEIRTPLSSILGFSSLLKEDITSPEHQPFIEKINSNAQRLTNALDDVITIAELEANSYKNISEDFSLHELLEQVTGDIQEKVRLKGLDLQVKENFPSEKTVHAYPKVFQKILTHLLDNAVKFTPHGRIEIRSVMNESENPEETKLVFEVEDTGIGIDPSIRPLLFKAFGQADSSLTRQYEGLGLGLLLSRKLAQSIEGQVDLIDSTPGKGSCFQLKWRQ